MIRATYLKSAGGHPPAIRETIASLGFRKLHQTRELPDNEAVRGMLKAVSFLVVIEGAEFVRPRRRQYKIPRARSIKKHSRGH